jgi:hypothetical protein
MDPTIRAAMAETIQELYKIRAIELVPLEPGDKPIKAIWIHQPKYDAAGKFLRIKSRLCLNDLDSAKALILIQIKRRRMHLMCKPY